MPRKKKVSALTIALDALESAQAYAKEAEAVAKAAKEEYDRLSIEVVPKLMEAEGIDSVKRGDMLFYIRHDLFANVDAEQRGALAATLRELGEEALITEYVFPQTLTAWAKERLENGEAIPPQVNLRRVTRAVPRKA